MLILGGRSRGYFADILSHNPNIRLNIVSLLENTEDNPQHELLNKIAAFEFSFIACEKYAHVAGTKKLGALDKYIPNMGTVVLYYRLAFARNNDWINFICCKLSVSSFRLSISIGFTPMILPKSKIITTSSNPNLIANDADNILKRLAARKNWNIH
ncbi:hypothetical protein ACVS9P_04980 [Caproicibacterium sp. NSD3]